MSGGSRECGNCSLCCRLMGVPEVKKDHDWCPHCRPGRAGCQIYEDRPQRCRNFLCRWLIDERFGDHWFPAKARIIVDVAEREGRTFVLFIVDPDYPLRWREEPWFSDIKTVAAQGLGKLDASPKWTTLVMIKGDITPIVL